MMKMGKSAIYENLVRKIQVHVIFYLLRLITVSRAR